MNTLETMQLGQSVAKVSRLGMGCWATGGHGWGKVSDDDSIRAIRCALENGITFYDTADVYGFGKSETLLAEVLDSSRHDVVIASKGGVRWNESGKIWTDGSPAYLKLAVENSLRRLRLNCIPLYYIHKPDNVTPLQESVAALERMREEGKIGAIGVANFSADQLLEALQIAKIAAIQVRLNIFERDAINALLSICKKHSVTFVAWGALADGLLTGKFKPNTNFSDDDHRSRMTIFKGNSFLKNINCVKMLEQMAANRGHKVSQLALRWVLDYSDCICALFGAKTDIQVMENLGVKGWRLTEKEFEMIDTCITENYG